MEKFVPYEKLSKKKRRELDLMRRGSWGGLNPVTRKPANPKAYNRKKAQSWKNDSGSALLFKIEPAAPGSDIFRYVWDARGAAPHSSPSRRAA